MLYNMSLSWTLAHNAILTCAAFAFGAGYPWYACAVLILLYAAIIAIGWVEGIGDYFRELNFLGGSLGNTINPVEILGVPTFGWQRFTDGLPAEGVKVYLAVQGEVTEETMWQLERGMMVADNGATPVPTRGPGSPSHWCVAV